MRVGIMHFWAQAPRSGYGMERSARSGRDPRSGLRTEDSSWSSTFSSHRSRRGPNPILDPRCIQFIPKLSRLAHRGHAHQQNPPSSEGTDSEKPFDQGCELQMHVGGCGHKESEAAGRGLCPHKQLGPPCRPTSSPFEPTWGWAPRRHARARETPVGRNSQPRFWAASRPG